MASKTIRITNFYDRNCIKNLETNDFNLNEEKDLKKHILNFISEKIDNHEEFNISSTRIGVKS